MATVGAEDVEYESDPEEAKRSLAMRRRAAASDDEEGEGEGREKSRPDRSAPAHSDDESDDQGGAAEYDDDDELVEDEEEEEVYEEEEEPYVERGPGGETVLVLNELEDVGGSDGRRRSVDGKVDEDQGGEDEGEEEKKENEPFAVPTAGAFYMHDDRFRDNAGGRSRRIHGGRKLWESKDDKKWGHDKFEEITLHERHHEEGRRSSRGNFRGRGRNRGMDRGSATGNRTKEYETNNQRQVPKAVRGRGPRRYEPAVRNNRQSPSTQHRQSGKSVDKVTQANSERNFAPPSNAESDSVPARKDIFASSLNSASPPFYPSGSSNKEFNLNPKRDAHVGNAKRNARPSVSEENISGRQANAYLRGKNVPESVGIGMEKPYFDDSKNPGSGKNSATSQISSSGSSIVTLTPASHFRVHGRGANTGHMSYRPVGTQNQMPTAPSPQFHGVQRNPVQNRSQLAVQAPPQQLGQRPVSGSQASSPPKTPGEVEPSDSSKIKGALVAKGKGSTQGNGRGALTYNGAQVIEATGAMAVNHGDQNFPGTPAFLPVMQFGGQHPGGMGVPAVGMAFPGYVAQPQLGGGIGNSEMTWLPVLAGAAGALGAAYCPPYITVDGCYHARPSGQTSVGPLSKENNVNKTNNEWKPSEKPEIVGDEYGQRQNKPRRYSQMNVASDVLQNNTELV
ncbi:protein MLN51 homolog [Argentina anserina]|uniref:protein MLN51 homolog n=1 Tax=Argentina anserina TaxID=57926 RepID=UPI0021767D32|nr:protein MLN51 homolog [Potentilla anserina]XP_050384716.1 protein MLN51 homolog [Potentilla anserina]XP_050384717.1 protein MLN51 homolog [Potentilla anserina]XP_050384718.1 protein MLN51 homolog [Potentilla anserina]XP_050384719.1 protein MLN51 homolog [Potentilla anserina]